VLKELRQLKRNRRLVAMLILPPTVNLLFVGVAMNPEVTGLRLGVVDDSHTGREPRAGVGLRREQFVRITGKYTTVGALSKALSRVTSTRDRRAAGLSDQRARGETAEIQFLVDGVNSNTASVASGYVSRILASLNARLAPASVNRIGASRRAWRSSTTPACAARGSS
jgi:ABC-2 type transport system permease protein